MRNLQAWIFVILCAMTFSCAHQPRVSSFSDSMHPTGQGWFLDGLSGLKILFRKHTDKGMYHTVVAYAEFQRIGLTIEDPGGKRRDIGSVAELLPYVKSNMEMEYQGSRFKNADFKTLTERYFGNDCVRADFTVEDHGVPSAPGSAFILTGREYYCLHPTSTESSAYVIHLHVSQRYLQGEKPFSSLDTEVQPFFKSYVEGSTIPLIKASKEGDLASVQKLVASGADVNAKADIISDWGKTALMEASLRGYVDIVAALLKAGADVNTNDDYGDTALIFAAGKGYYDIIKLLLLIRAINS